MLRMGVSDPAKKELSQQQKDRAASTKLFQFSAPHIATSYADDYGPKAANKTAISDFSAENMRNNPHPKEAFLSWRLPSRFPPLIEGCTLSHISSAEFLEDGSRQRNLKTVSTYQKDYTKESQNVDDLPPVSSATNTHPYPSTDVTYSPHLLLPPLSSSRTTTVAGAHSEMNEAYRAPRTTRHLKGNTSRYGCSSNYVKAACGVVPTLHPIVNAPNYQTWYANEFGVGNACGYGGHRRPPTPFYPLHLPPIIKEGKEAMGKSVRLHPHKHRHYAKEKREAAKKIEPNSPPGPGGLSWLSEWAGPM